jgi:hypothetical protein
MRTKAQGAARREKSSRPAQVKGWPGAVTAAQADVPFHVHPNGGPEHSQVAENKDEPLLTLRAAFILTAAVLVSSVAGILTYFVSASLPEAFLAAGPTCAGVVTLLNAIVG